MLRKINIPFYSLALTFSAFCAVPQARAQSALGQPLDAPFAEIRQTPPAPANLTTPLPYKPDNVGNLEGTWNELSTTVGNKIRVTDNDNDNSQVQVIGFPFRYRGVNFTQFVLNTNGFIKLGNQPPSRPDLFFSNIQGYTGGALYSPNAADSNIISIFNHDLAPAATGTPDFRVLTTGTTPNRVCTIQFKGMRDKPDASGAVGNQFSTMAFQIKLFEGTNFIEFVYGPFVASTNAPIFRSAGVGLKGATPQQTLVGVKFSGSDWSGTQFSTGPNNGSRNEHNFRNAFPPDLGRTYRFTTPLAKNISVRSILGLPNDGCSLPASATIGVVFSNAGYENQTNIPIGLRVDNTVFPQVLARLDSNKIDTVFFNNVNLSAVGRHVIKAYAKLPGDQLPFNDTLRADTVFNIAPQQASGDTNSFESDRDINGVTAWNQNGDDFVWAINTDANFTRTGARSLVFRNNATRINDDWLLTSCYQLEKDTVYTLRFSYRTIGATAPQAIDILVLDEQNPNGTGKLIFADPGMVQLSYKDTAIYFTVDTSGTKYIGFWNHSPAAAGIFLLDDVSVNNDTLTIATRPSVPRGRYTVAPNPATSRISLRGPRLAQTGYYALAADGTRQRLTAAAAGLNEVTFSIAGLRPGVYALCGADGRQLARFAKTGN